MRPPKIVKALLPGSGFVYFTGDLSAEREDVRSNGEKTERANRISALAAFMLRQGTSKEFSHGDGNVVLGYGNGMLTRRRIGRCVYAYIFTKRRECDAQES